LVPRIASVYSLTDEFDDTNIEDGITINDWVEQQSSDPNIKWWATRDNRFYHERGLEPFGASKQLFPILAIVTRDALNKWLSK
jgi:hypothetical protein